MSWSRMTGNGTRATIAGAGADPLGAGSWSCWGESIHRTQSMEWAALLSCGTVIWVIWAHRERERLVARAGESTEQTNSSASAAFLVSSRHRLSSTKCSWQVADIALVLETCFVHVFLHYFGLSHPSHFQSTRQSMLSSGQDTPTKQPWNATWRSSPRRRLTLPPHFLLVKVSRWALDKFKNLD